MVNEPPAAVTRPAACAGEIPSCGVLPDDVDCGPCPGGLECGAVAPNRCGGIVCDGPVGHLVLHHLSFSWSGMGAYRSPRLFDRMYVTAAFEDTEQMKFQVERAPNRHYVKSLIDVTPEVITADLAYSESHSYLPMELVVACVGTATYSFTWSEGAP